VQLSQAAHQAQTVWRGRLTGIAVAPQLQRLQTRMSHRLTFPQRKREKWLSKEPTVFCPAQGNATTARRENTEQPYLRRNGCSLRQAVSWQVSVCSAAMCLPASIVQHIGSCLTAGHRVLLASLEHHLEVVRYFRKQCIDLKGLCQKIFCSCFSCRENGTWMR
jgi:hypothetical protein